MRSLHCFSDRGPCPPDSCFWCFTLHTRVSCQPSEPLRPVHRCLSVDLKSFVSNCFVERLETKNMHGCIYSQCIYAFISALEMHCRITTPTDNGVGGFPQAKKNPPNGGFYLTAIRLTGVHAPPEDVTEDDDLFFLDFLEGVVLVRMFIAIEAAQANPGRQTI